ncbi:MAG TPA: Ig-like domain-containing protein [Vicinamibacterales bacterium]
MIMARVSLALFAAVLAAACERVALTAPTASTITITSDQAVLPLNGTATLRAVVIEAGGTPVHNGTTVTFTSTLGIVDPVEAKTVNGIATATFKAGSTSGKSTIKAFSGGAVTATGVDVTIGSAAAKSIALTATPSSVSQSGGTVTVAALVLDESGNPLPGVPVNFSADAGQLNPTTALSDASGVARTQLSTTQTSKVTATAGTATKDVTVNASAAPTVAITAPDTGNIGFPVTMTVTASSGPATAPRQIQTLTVDFGDGTAETRTNVTGTAAFTHTYNQARAYTITAVATDVAGNTGSASDSIVINRAQPTATLTAPATVDYSDTSGIAGFTVGATAAAGQPPVQSVVVRLGDGTVIYSGSSGGSFTYQFGGTGTYAVNATVTDTAGGVGTASAVVRVVP